VDHDAPRLRWARGDDGSSHVMLCLSNKARHIPKCSFACELSVVAGPIALGRGGHSVFHIGWERVD